MGILDKIESGIERAVNTLFARTFKSGLQPVEILSALRTQLDTKATIVAKNNILVPHIFSIAVSEDDHSRLQNFGDSLIDELTTELNSYAKKQGYRFLHPVKIVFIPNLKLKPGMMKIEASGNPSEIEWSPAVIVQGKKYSLSRGITVLGRSSQADIPFPDGAASRQHLEFNWNNDGKIQVRDLNSTNGTKLNGLEFKAATINSDCEFVIGKTKVYFRFEPTEKTD